MGCNERRRTGTRILRLAGPSRGWGSCGLQHDAVVCVGWLDHDGLSLAQEINRENVERWSQIR